MGNNFTRLAKVPWRRGARAFMAAVLALSLMGVSAQPYKEAKAQLVLLQLAQHKPDSKVSVIVQKADKNANLESMVTRLGGKVTKDLHIINAFAAVMPAGKVEELARADGVRFVSMDSAMDASGGGQNTTGSGVYGPVGSVNTGNLLNVYTKAVKATGAWNTSPGYYQGQGMTVAVVDSGVQAAHADLASNGQGSTTRVVASEKFNSNTNALADQYGHGTHVAGIIAGNGTVSQGAFIGIAPRANLVNVKVSDDLGAANASDVVAGLQWVLDNKDTYGIKVVNLSLNQSVPESYKTNPLCAAVEVLWFNKIVVVVSAGNNGSAALYPPANDPFVITVGAVDDKDSITLSDDTLAPFSAYGVTESGFAKPDVVAPGVKIKGLLASSGTVLAGEHPSAIVPGYSNKYFQMSGTSMAAPVVAGAAALLLQWKPDLTPDQVKYRLMSTATYDLKAFPAYNKTTMGAGYLNIQQAIVSTLAIKSANTGVPVSTLLTSGGEPINWGSVNWNSVNWNSVNWNSVNWNSVNWNSVNWNSDWWGQ